MVTHRLTSIAKYDQIFVMSVGHLVERGSHAELVALGGVYVELWAEQTGGVASTDSPFDVVGGVARRETNLSSLSRDDLAAAAERLRVLDLPAGARLAENSGTLALVRKGRPAWSFTPALDGRLSALRRPAARRRVQISALLGAETGAVLVAEEPAELLVLDADALSGLAALHPEVADAGRFGAGRGPGRTRRW